jgi:hypothetical protein
MVPAVSEVWRPQASHSNLVFSKRQLFWLPQCGQQKPFGQRIRLRYSRQDASFENRLAKVAELDG